MYQLLLANYYFKLTVKGLSVTSAHYLNHLCVTLAISTVKHLCLSISVIYSLLSGNCFKKLSNRCQLFNFSAGLLAIYFTHT